jgi:hypothetical protein
LPNLTHIIFNNNNINTLIKEWPKNLKYITINIRSFQFDTLPPNLLYLNFNESTDYYPNTLFKLPILPDTIKFLKIGKSIKPEIKKLPKNLIHLEFYGLNAKIDFFTIPKSLQKLVINDCTISNY